MPQHPEHITIGNLDSLTEDADFALFDMPFDIPNMVEDRQVNGWLPDAQFSFHSMDLRVLLGCTKFGDPVNLKATMLREKACLFVQGRRFQTRTIALEEPLEIGVSGSWVVQGDKLCGIIVSTYHPARFAHIVTAEKMFSDIKKTTGIMPELPIHSSKTEVPEPTYLSLQD
ncbi:unnamed protein product [Discula destructiva]